MHGWIVPFRDSDIVIALAQRIEQRNQIVVEIACCFGGDERDAHGLDPRKTRMVAERDN